MLSGKGNESVKKKTTIGLISRKVTLHVQRTHIFVHFFAVVLHDYNVKLPETSWLHVLWRKCRFRSVSPWWSLAILIFSPPLQNFMLFPQQKKVSFVFSLQFQLFFSFSFTGLSPYFLFFSVFLFLCIPNLWTLTINLSLILYTTRIQKHFPLSAFVFIDSLVVSASQDLGSRTLSRQNNLTFIIGLHEVVCTDGWAYATS